MQFSARSTARNKEWGFAIVAAILQQLRLLYFLLGLVLAKNLAHTVQG